MLNHLDLFCNHLVLTGSSPHISIEACQLNWIQFFSEKQGSVLPDTAARIFVRVEIGS